MTSPPTAVLHVLGCAAPGDTTTAAARAIRDGLAAEGRPGQLAAVQVRGTCGDVDRLRTEQLDGALVVLHTVDGGETVAPLLDSLRRSRLHLVHHGSRPGSDRSVLRSLRDVVTVAAGSHPAAREELRGLGFGEPAALPSRLPAGSALAADVDATDHPGPYLLAVGPIAEERSIELLVDAFAQLLQSELPSAVLSICGPASPWYRDLLLRRVLRRGLTACEVIEPPDEQAVRTRLARCDVYVALQPTGFEPYLWDAARRAAVVAPRVAATAALAGSPGFVEVDVAPTRDGVAHALHRAAAAPAVGGVFAGSPSGTTALRAVLQVA